MTLFSSNSTKILGLQTNWTSVSHMFISDKNQKGGFCQHLRPESQAQISKLEERADFSCSSWDSGGGWIFDAKFWEQGDRYWVANANYTQVEFQKAEAKPKKDSGNFGCFSLTLTLTLWLSSGLIPQGGDVSVSFWKERAGRGRPLVSQHLCNRGVSILGS